MNAKKWFKAHSKVCSFFLSFNFFLLNSIFCIFVKIERKLFFIRKAQTFKSEIFFSDTGELKYKIQP
jgi:hypothetical protein